MVTDYKTDKRLEWNPNPRTHRLRIKLFHNYLKQRLYESRKNFQVILVLSNTMYQVTLLTSLNNYYGIVYHFQSRIGFIVSPIFVYRKPWFAVRKFRVKKVNVRNSRTRSESPDRQCTTPSLSQMDIVYFIHKDNVRRATRGLCKEVSSVYMWKTRQEPPTVGY